jgi:flavin-dependent dehydrogenase
MIQNSIVIVGGLAGLIAAIHLKNNNYNVLVIEKMNFLNTKFVENIFQRSFTLLKS